jgi:hypothetical protein
LLTIFQFFLPLNIFSAENDQAGQSTMAFLRIDPVARSVGIGEAATCLENDVNSLFHNIAGVAKISGGVISMNHTQWLADMKQYSVAVAYGKPWLGTFGLSLIVMDNGEITRTVPDNSDRGFHLEEPFTVNQFAIGVAYGRRTTDRFSFGGQVKYIFQDLGPADIIDQTVNSIDTLRNIENKAGTFALDFGTVYYTGFKDLRLAMSIRNFSSSIKYSYDSFQLPSIIKIGVAINVMSLFTSSEDQALQMYIDVGNPNDLSEKINVGSEYSFNDLLFLRAGYRFNYDEGNFSLGFGLSPSATKINLKLDYAYSDYGTAFGVVHRFSLGLGL